MSSPGARGGPSAVTVRGDVFDPGCPTRRLLDRIGTKWTSMVVKVLAESAPSEVRFADLRRLVPGVSHKMLSQTLQSMRRDGLVRRRVEPEVPPRVHYTLTPLGLSLDEPLAALREWAEHHMGEIDDFAAQQAPATGTGDVNPRLDPGGPSLSPQT